MDIKSIGSKLIQFLKKYRYVVLVLAIGLVLMSLPDRKTTQQTATEDKPSASYADPTEELTQILSQIRGAGKVKLLLTIQAGEKTVYQTDRDTTSSDNSDSVRVETVVVTGSDRGQAGLVQQTIAPQYRGAIVVCQGADDDGVRLAVIEAVADATGLGTDRISVLKMK